MNILRNRKSIRLASYDYSQPGLYFVTLCTHQRECRFGQIIDGEMHPNSLGQIVMEQWQQLPARFPNVLLDAFVVMPNHLHGIIQIVGAPLAGAQSLAGAQPNHTENHDESNGVRAPARGAPTVGNIVGAYKSLCVHDCLQWTRLYEPSGYMGKLWQRNYWEHIIRDEDALNKIRQYINNNPRDWEKDDLHTEAINKPENAF